MNKVVLVGRITADPELRYTSGTNAAVCNFTIAVDRPFQANGGERGADFIPVVVWNKQAENVKNYLTKGSQVAVEGRIQVRNYDDQNGQKRYATDFIVENAYFADSRRDQDMPAGEVPSSSMDGEFITVEDTDDLPF